MDSLNIQLIDFATHAALSTIEYDLIMEVSNRLDLLESALKRLGDDEMITPSQKHWYQAELLARIKYANETLK